VGLDLPRKEKFIILKSQNPLAFQRHIPETAPEIAQFIAQEDAPENRTRTPRRLVFNIHR
jgi:hypothetical protein